MNAVVPHSGQQAQEASLAKAGQYLTFTLGGESFALGIMSIKEIIQFGGLTTVPMMPPAIRGVINLRGAVVPVLDLAARFSREPGEVTKRTCIVIVEIASEGAQHVIGVVVDAVNAVMDIPATDIEPAPAFGARVRSDFIAGMGKVGGKFVILLDANMVLSTAELGALAATEAMAA